MINITWKFQRLTGVWRNASKQKFDGKSRPASKLRIRIKSKSSIFDWNLPKLRRPPVTSPVGGIKFSGSVLESGCAAFFKFQNNFENLAQTPGSNRLLRLHFKCLCLKTCFLCLVTSWYGSIRFNTVFAAGEETDWAPWPWATNTARLLLHGWHWLRDTDLEPESDLRLHFRCLCLKQ